ncbi:Uu.00g146010.m01.CDS01 [Anthostomella pinea]|uniref:Uu.00g146010.m01.CDS01 n=1 Tax=Anthostomella pinea TaxID=933095 RepID=A0AAI8YM17_9PEZI|nr:Uu.00g146010.m01.CDS01 [Anthostomella pinea]
MYSSTLLQLLTGLLVAGSANAAAFSLQPRTPVEEGALCGICVGLAGSWVMGRFPEHFNTALEDGLLGKAKEEAEKFALNMAAKKVCEHVPKIGGAEGTRMCVDSDATDSNPEAIDQLDETTHAKILGEITQVGASLSTEQVLG